MKAVQEIVDLVAKYPPMAVVTRLIDSFNKVTTCKRQSREDLNRFISGFRGLAAEHLMRAGSSNHSQIGEVLAIALLNNASFSEASLTNAKLRLIGMAEERAKLNTEPEAQVNLTFVRSMSLLRRIGALRKTLEKFKKDSRTGRALVKKMNQNYNHVASSLFPALQQSNRNRGVADVSKAIASNGPRCIFSLDDAVAVLRSIAQTGSKSDQAITRAQMDSAVDQKVRSFLSNKKKDRKPNLEKNWKTGKATGSKRKLEPSVRRDERKSKKFRLSNRASDACMDCGDNSHIRSDLKCKSPSFATLKIQEAKSTQDSDETDDENQTNQGGYFRPGSKHTKGKGAS